MKIIEVLQESNELDKAEFILALGQVDNFDKETFNHKRLEKLSTSIQSAYTQHPEHRNTLRGAAIILSSSAADYIAVIDHHPSKNDPAVMRLREKIENIRQDNINLFSKLQK